MSPNVPSDLFFLDNTQAVQKTHLISFAPLLPLFTNELDIPEFFQYNKEKYESHKSKRGQWRNSSHFDTCNALEQIYNFTSQKKKLTQKLILSLITAQYRIKNDVQKSKMVLRNFVDSSRSLVQVAR
jgi:hypothetical protein